MSDVINTYINQRYDTAKSVFNKFPACNNVRANYSVKLNLPRKKESQSDTKDKLNKTALVACGAGVGLLLLSKGVQKYAKNSLEKVKNHLEGKIDTSALNDSNKKLTFYEYSLRSINSFLSKAESINNINSMKDILFLNTMYKTPLTKKIHKGISRYFENLSINTVKKSYKKTEKDFNNMYKTFDDLDEYILKTSGDEQVEYNGEKIAKKTFIKKAKDHRESVRLVVNAFMMDNSQAVRYKTIKEATSQLYSKFWNKSFKGFWSKDNKFQRKEMWQTFIAAEQIKGNKTALAKDVVFARNILSYTEEEKMAFLSSYMMNLDSIIPTSDVEGVEIMKHLKWFKNNPQALKNSKDIFLKELDKLEAHNSVKDENLLNDKLTNIALIRSMVEDSGTGALQDMLDIYYRIAPFELSKSGALKSAQKAVSSFDKSVHLEIGEFFDKARDLELGSAPTDVLTILLSCGMITYGLEKAHSQDERASVVLKSGIPLVGAVATSLISATKLVAGSKSIALGLVSGIVLNRIGTVADNYRKKKSNRASKTVFS